MSTAIQNIERCKGAREERKWIISEVKSLIKLYKGDIVLEVLLEKLRQRDRNSE